MTQRWCARPASPEHPQRLATHRSITTRPTRTSSVGAHSPYASRSKGLSRYLLFSWGINCQFDSEMLARGSHEVLGHYEIFERLGQGGMATVNRAEMHGLAGFRKPVALKRLHPHVAKDPTMVQSLVQEAQLASHLHHP